MYGFWDSQKLTFTLGSSTCGGGRDVAICGASALDERRVAAGQGPRGVRQAELPRVRCLKGVWSLVGHFHAHKESGMPFSNEYSA